MSIEFFLPMQKIPTTTHQQKKGERPIWEANLL